METAVKAATKAKVCARAVCFFLLFLTVCVGNLVGCTVSDADDPVSLIRRYDVYQLGATTDNPSEFSIAMENNPISARMSYELHTQNIGTTYEFQVFYGDYLKIWQDELAFSIDNLKTYLSYEEALELEAAQEVWEKSVYDNRNFDNSVISNHGVQLGSQYTYSALGYLLEQYRDRVIHIKYMTYLLEENHAVNAVPRDEQLWNRWLQA